MKNETLKNMARVEPHNNNNSSRAGNFINKSRIRKKVILYTDGACRGNPGPGGYGSVLLYTDNNGETHRKEFSKGYPKTTNNRMEIMAVIAGLEGLKVPCDVEVFSDSSYVVNAFNQHWIDSWKRKGWKNSTRKTVKNKELWVRLDELVGQHTVKFVWVKGHAGNAENERCDKLATQAADECVKRKSGRK